MFKRTIFFITVAVILIITSLFYAFYFSKIKNGPGDNQSKFSYSECKGDNVDGDDFLSDYIKEVRWEESRLIVKLRSKHNCAVKKIIGRSEINGDNIVLSVGGTYNGMSYSCECDYDAEFSFKELPKMDYKIILNSEGKKTDQLTLKTDSTVSDMCDQDRSYDCYTKNFSALKYPKSAKEITSSKSTQQKEFIYDTEENKKIAESNPDFLRLFKKYRYSDYNDYDTIYLSYGTINLPHNEKLGFIEMRATRKGGGSESSGRLISNVSNFQDGVNKYVSEKKRMEAPGSFEAQLKEKLGTDFVRVYPNEAGFVFMNNGEEITYSSSSLDFANRKELNKIMFLDGFPKATEINSVKLIELVGVVEKVYQLIKDNEGIDSKSILGISVKLSDAKARFIAKTNPEIENKLRYVKVHSFELPIKDPIQKRYELNINSGELNILIGDERVDKY